MATGGLPDHWHHDFHRATGADYKLATQEDLEVVKRIALGPLGWNTVVDKETVKVWDRAASAAPMVRLWARMSVSAATLYDVLHDPDYRSVWDTLMDESHCVQMLDSYNDICYFRAKSPVSLVDPRDFCSQRSWYVAPDQQEYVIWNRAVPHRRCPPKKGVVRARTHLTGMVVRPLDPGSCTFVYVTQTDMGGWIPPHIMDELTKRFAPKLARRLERAADVYPAWKKEQQSEKPWISEEKYSWEQN